MRPIKYDVLKNDQRLMEMALYEKTKGQTVHIDIAEVVEILSEYKSLIRRKEFTIDQLEDRVFSTFGVMNSNSQRDTNLYDADIDEEVDPLGGALKQFFSKYSKWDETSLSQDTTDDLNSDKGDKDESEE